MSFCRLAIVKGRKKKSKNERNVISDNRGIDRTIRFTVWIETGFLVFYATALFVERSSLCPSSQGDNSKWRCGAFEHLFTLCGWLVGTFSALSHCGQEKALARKLVGKKKKRNREREKKKKGRRRRKAKCLRKKGDDSGTETKRARQFGVHGRGRKRAELGSNQGPWLAPVVIGARFPPRVRFCFRRKRRDSLCWGRRRRLEGVACSSLVC